jgi:hypothetical protein
MAEATEKAKERTVYDAIRHLRECPEQRVESFVATRPSGDRVGIVRCIDCGESSVVEENEVVEAQETMRKQVAGSSRKA